MPRSSVAVAKANRQRIIDTAVARASVEGLHGVTLGPLADELGMSKAGVIAPFGSRAALLDAVLERACEVFVQQVVAPAYLTEPGLRRLHALIDRWVDYLTDGPFPNGCFVIASECELDGRPGALRDQLARVVSNWHDVLRREIDVAIERGELVGDPNDLVFTLVGLAMATNQAVQLDADTSAAQRARRLMRDALV